jgi:hypothetical protein
LRVREVISFSRIDTRGVAWGIVFSVLVTAIYNGLVSLLNWDFREFAIFGVAGLITFVIVVIAFRNLLLPD